MSARFERAAIGRIVHVRDGESGPCRAAIVVFVYCDAPGQLSEGLINATMFDYGGTTSAVWKIRSFGAEMDLKRHGVERSWHWHQQCEEVDAILKAMRA